MKFPIIDERGNVEGLLGINRDITEQRLAVNAIRESEEKFRRIFETAIEGIILISSNGKSYAMNKTMNDLIKLPAGTQEIEIIDFIHQDWLERYQDKIEQIKTGKPYQSDFCYTKTDGSILWVSESSVAIFDDEGNYNGYLSMIADVSDRVKAHTKIIKQRDLFEAVSRASNILITKKDYYIGIYESMEILGESALIDCISIFQMDPGSATDPYNFGRIYEWQASTSNSDSGIHNLIPKLINRPDSLSARTLESGESFVMQNIIDVFPETKTNDFSNLSSSILLIPIHMREQFWGFIEYRFPNLDYDWFEDIKAILTAFTSSIGSAIEQKINADNLKEAKIAAEEANRSKSEFLANMSHEIRTPLTAVIGFSELLINRITDKQHIKFLNTILNSSNSLLALINDILDLSKIEAGKLEILPKAINMKRILLEIEQIFSQKIHEKNLSFLVDIEDNIPEFLILDEVRFRQILFNLVGNAVKFTENGFIKIKITPTNFSNTKTDLIISVEDTGIGISRDLQESIFDAFSQQSSHTARKYGGTGLGLAITKRLAEKMNGTITLKSEPGLGSTFRIVVKDIIVTDEAKKADSTKYPSVSDYKFVESRILLVDDFEYNRELIKYYLNGSNIEITESITGEDALYLAKIILPDLILMDVKLPGMDGNIVAQKLKEDPDFADIPIIAFTASSASDEVGDFFEHFDGYIRKPINSTNLYNELKRFIALKDQVNNSESDLIDEYQDFNNEIDNLDNEKRQKLALILHTNILPRMKNLSEVLIIDDIDLLFREINQINTEFGIRKIDNFISVMFDTLQSYDVKKIKKVLNDFYDFLLILIGNEFIE
jgi:PAS domain S-box-containing protein